MAELADHRHPCEEGDACLHVECGYPWCVGCGEHHRAPVAEPGEECPVDQMIRHDTAIEVTGT